MHSFTVKQARAFNSGIDKFETNSFTRAVSSGHAKEKPQGGCCHYHDDSRDFGERAVILRYDKRVKPNRDAGFGTGRRLLAEFPNPGQADCESLSIANRVGSDAMGGGGSVSRIPTRRMDLWDGDRFVKERAFSSFHWVCELVTAPR